MNYLQILLLKLSAVVSTGDAGVPKWVWIVMAISLIAIIALFILGRLSNKNNDNIDKKADGKSDNNQRTQI